jgi:hypothetical protein
VPGIKGVPSLLNNGGGSGPGDGRVGPLIPVKDSTGPLAAGALTPGIIGKSIPGMFVGLPSLFGSALAGVNTLANKNSKSKPLNNTLSIDNILNQKVLVSNTYNNYVRLLRSLLECKKPGPCN